MAGLEGILEHIVSDAQKKASEILANSSLKEADILEQAELEAAQKRDEARAFAEAEGVRSSERIIISANLKARKKTLETKQTIISECFNSALKELLTQSEAEYKKLIDSMIKKVATDDAEIIMIPRNPVNLTGGGFILQKGRVKASYEFSKILQKIRIEKEQEILKALGW